ncbi:hypothetical protein NHX12_017161 [Muraenolepis orangiensis]|uniref:Uncharacterized protein n=1 Tax=Muraenolepis orangiensis TaxID=630683 RepID=A0A9Q0D3G3_9TELE|nr:hypothetical protein NHX12_017161 [Muraenolepis orangiensis]
MFGDQVLQTPPELDRAHRTLGDKPRPVIVFTDIKPKSWTRRSAYEDYCPEVQEQRAAYRNVMAKLYNLGLRPALLYPAKLQITDKEANKKRFSSAEEAIAFIGDHVSHNSSGVGPGVKVAPCLLLGACFMVGLPVNIAVIFDICRNYKR